MTSQQNFRYFDWVDYSVFGLLLSGSVCIGIYFGFLSKRKQNTKLEYLFGSRELGIIPVAMSLIATQLTPNVIVGYPAEVYVHGTQILGMLFLEFVLGSFMAYFILPVFYDLGQISMYEYLNRRFSPAVRTIGSFMFVLKMVLLLPVIVYGSTLVLAQVSGISLQVIIPVSCLVCVFYTTIGGMKAVVWTDTIQYLVIAASTVFIVVMGTIAVGGPAEVFHRGSKGERLEIFNMSLDPTVVHTFWSTVIGRSIYRHCYFSVNQGTIQRCLSLTNLKNARIALGLMYVGIFLTLTGAIVVGLLVYATFADCDPLTAGIVAKADQIIPYFVMKVTSHIPALPGIFLSAVFSASLSTLSTGLNSMSAVIVEDFIQPLYNEPISEARASVIMKLLTLGLGAIIMCLTFMVQHMTGIVQAGTSAGGAAVGGLMGVLVLGMFLPWANSHGALAGTVSALGLVSWMAFGQQKAIYDKRIVFPKKPFSIAGCDNSTLAHYHNRTTQLHAFSNGTSTESDEPAFYLYRISYNWYACIGIVTVVTVGMLVSWLTGLNNPRDMDHQLFSPAIRRFLPKERRKRRTNGTKTNWLDATTSPVDQNIALMTLNE